MHYPDQKKQRMSFQMLRRRQGHQVIWKLTPASKVADEAEKKE